MEKNERTFISQMKTIKTPIKPSLSTYPCEKLGNREELLFVDIETTGLSPDTAFVYLIGCAAMDREGSITLHQWMAESRDEEEDVIYAFYNFAIPFKKLIHYNGNRFDIPFLQKRCELLELPYDLRIFEGIDIYRRLKPYKEFLKLMSMKQKDLEELLGIEREDTFSGKELIDAYLSFLDEPTDEWAELILLHNSDDLRGLIGIVPLLAVSDMFNDPIKVVKAGRNPYTDMDGSQRSEVIMEIALPTPLPLQISYGWSDCYFTGEGARGKLRVSVYEGELKYFYPDYKDYYYIPEEDVAVHKSVASFVDNSFRERAKASNCYTRKSGSYLPQWEPLFSPVMRANYNEPTMYFELTNEFKRDPKSFTKYAKHLLSVLLDPN